MEKGDSSNICVDPALFQIASLRLHNTCQHEDKYVVQVPCATRLKTPRPSIRRNMTGRSTGHRPSDTADRSGDSIWVS